MEDWPSKTREQCYIQVENKRGYKKREIKPALIHLLLKNEINWSNGLFYL